MATTLVAPPTEWRELDGRRSDGLTITLRWSERTGRVQVIVEDERENRDFVIDVDDPADAMYAYHHPYVYRNVQEKLRVARQMLERS